MSVFFQLLVYLKSGLFAIENKKKILCRGHCHYKILLLFAHILYLNEKVSSLSASE